MAKKAAGFGREVLIEICDYLMNQEDEALGCEERSMHHCTTICCCGTWWGGFVHHLELGPVGSAAAATTPADANEASTTSTTSTKTVDEELTAPKRTIRCETLLRGMPCDQFVQEVMVMWCNVTFHADHFLPATAMRTDSKERKEKLRKLRLDVMEEVAEGEEKHIFLRSKIPGGDAYTEWLEHVKKTASTVAIRYAKSVIKRQLVAQDKYCTLKTTFLRCSINKRCPVYSKLEKTLKFEKNKEYLVVQSI